MGVMIAAGITATATLGAATLQAWLSKSAQEEALRENRRIEALNIKFSEEESAREMRRHGDNLGLEKDRLGLDKKQQKFDNMKTILDNITGLYNSNSEKFASVKDSFGSRRQR